MYPSVSIARVKEQENKLENYQKIKFQNFSEKCSSKNPDEAPVLLDNVAPTLPGDGNSTSSKTYKMIIHGYNGNLDFNGSKMIRNGEYIGIQVQIDEGRVSPSPPSIFPSLY